MAEFKVYSRDGYNTAEDAVEVEGVDAQHAAEVYVEFHWSDLEWPDEQDVVVIDADGVETHFNVTAENSMHFSAAEIEPKEVDDGEAF